MTYSSPSALGRFVEVVAGLLLVVVPLSVHAGVLDLFTAADTTPIVPEVIETDLVLDTPVLVASMNPDPTSSRR